MEPDGLTIKRQEHKLAAKLGVGNRMSIKDKGYWGRRGAWYLLKDLN